MLSSRLRAGIVSIVALSAAATIVVLVGRTTPAAAPDTYVEVVGRLDASFDGWVRSIRTGTLIEVSRALDTAGNAVALAILRGVVLVLLFTLRRFSASFAFAITWAISVPATEVLRVWLHRGRPPGALVEASSFSLPSGHTVAATSVGVALVIALTSGWWRGGLVIVAFAVGAAMGASQLVLSLNWLSDTVVGLLFGGGVAIASAVLVDAVAQRVPERAPGATRAPG